MTVAQVSDDSLRRARLMRYAETMGTVETLRKLRADLIAYFGGDEGHILTQADIDKLDHETTTNDKTIAFLRTYRGLPLKWVGMRNDIDVWNSVPKNIQVAWLLAREVGKSVDEVFTQADLDTVSKKYGWNDDETNFWRKHVGATFLGATGDIASDILTSLFNVLVNPLGTGVDELTGQDDALGKVLGFITKPENWLSIGGLLAGVLLIVYGGSRYLRGGQ